MARDRIRALRRRVYQVLEEGPIGDGFSITVDRLLVALILVNLAAVALESVPSLETRYALTFALIEYVSLVGLHRRVRAASLVARSSTGRISISIRRRRA